MSNNETREKALEAPLLAMPGRPPTAWPNGAPPDTDSLYLDVRHFHNRSSRVSVGTTHRRPGIMQITVIAPENTFGTAANTVADSIASLYGVDTVLPAGTENLRITLDPQVQGGFADSGYWRVPISIYWEVIS